MGRGRKKQYDANADIRKSGPQNYLELQAANASNFEGSALVGLESRRNTRTLDITDNPTGPMTSGLFKVNKTGEIEDYWGKSSYDEDRVSISDLENLGDIRANNQPWYAKVGAGLAKGAILAGTTFLDGTIGLITGIGTAIGEGRWSGLWDNDFSKAMKSINDWSEEAMPNYYTKKELEGPWYENIFTANFLGDKFIKNLGFTVGAFYGGGLITKPIKAVGALAKAGVAAKRAEGLISAAQAAEKVKNISNATSMVSMGVGSTLSAVNEGRIEALNNSTDWYNSQKELIDQAYAAGQLNDVQYEEALARANEDRLKMGNADLLMNLPILMASNIIQFGKLYANGMETAKKGLNIVGNAGNWASGSSKAGALWGITKGALSEGTEEISQSAASRIAGNYYATDVNNFVKAKTDPEASQETLSWAKAFADGINETVNDGSAWEEFFIGSLTGALGMPKFRGMKDSEGNWQSPVTIEEGAWNGWKQFREARAEENEVANYMNERFNSPEFKNYYQGLVRHNKYQNDMNKAAENDDPFEYHNAEHGQMISDVMMFDKAGKLGDLVSMINDAFDTSDENLESIVKNTTSTAEDGKTVGPFVDENGNPAYSTEKGKQQMIEQLTKNKDKILESVDDYVASREFVMQNLPKGAHLSDDQIDELTWMHSQINNWSDRAVEMSGEIKGALGKIVQDINADIAVQQSIRTQEGMKSADLTDAYKEADKRIQELEQAKRTLEHVRNLDDETLASSLSNVSNADFVDNLKDNIFILPESSMDLESKKSLFQKLDDVKKLAHGKETFNKKFNEYITNPEQQAADHQQAEQEAIAEEQTRTRNSLVEALNAANDMKSFRSAVTNSELDQTDKDAVLQQMKDEGNPLAQDYADVESYNREVRQALALSNLDDQTFQDAAQLLKDQYEASSTLQEISNTNSVYVNNDAAFDEVSENAEEAKQRFNNAQLALQEAMNKVNNDNKFKNRFAEQRPAPAPTTPNPDPAKGTDSDTTGDSGTTTVPPVNMGVQATEGYTPPVGNISSDMVASENTQNNNASYESPEDYDNKHEGAKPYYRPAIPEFHIESSRLGDFRPFNVVVKERESGVNFDTIYKYLEDKGAFKYINSGKLKVSDEIEFMIDPAFEESVKGASWHTKPTIFMVTKEGQVVGSLDEGASTVNFEGLPGLEERVRTEYAKWQQENPQPTKAQDSDEKEETPKPTIKTFVSPTQKTKVSKIMTGKIPYGKEERSLADIPNVRGADGTGTPIFGVIKNGTMSTNGAIDDNLVVKPMDMSQKEGRLYLLIPNGAGKYSPAAVRVKHFNNEEFNLEDATVADTPIGKDIIAGIEKMAETTNETDLKEAVKALNKDLYLGNLHIDWFETTDGGGIRFTKVERDSNGNEIYITDMNDGKRKRQETVKTVFMTSRPDPNLVYVIGEDNVARAPEATTKDIDTIVKEITDILSSFNLPIQVSIDRLGTKGYANRLINSGILTSNIADARVLGTWFTTDYFDNEGNLQTAVNPEGPSPTNPQQNAKVQTPVGGKDSVVPGVSISINGKEIRVDLQNNLIYEDDKPRLIEKYKDQMIVDLAWAQSLHGNRTEGHNMHNNCIVTPSGQVLNRTTQQYLTGDEAQKIKDIIDGKNKTRRERQEKAQRVINSINESQKRVAKDRTDDENYYIQEEDGQYYPYTRVHSRLGGNWTESEKQKEALKYVQTKLSQLVGTVSQYDGHLAWLEKKYEIDLKDFRGKTDIKSRQMILSIIRDKMAGTNSARALEAGSAVDTVLRQYFTTTDPSTITRPSNMSEKAFSDLMTRLQEIKSNMENQQMTFLTNNIVLYQKYPDGTRIAGEVDILAVDRDGNFRIYDVKTSKWPFGNFTRNGRQVNFFENKAPTQRMSTKAYYTLQLSAYKNLFESQFGVPITQLAIMPFMLSYEGNTVSEVKGEAGIPITYNPAVNVPLTRNVSSETQTGATAEPTTEASSMTTEWSSENISKRIAIRSSWSGNGDAHLFGDKGIGRVAIDPRELTRSIGDNSTAQSNLNALKAHHPDIEIRQIGGDEASPIVYAEYNAVVDKEGGKGQRISVIAQQGGSRNGARSITIDRPLNESEINALSIYLQNMTKVDETTTPRELAEVLNSANSSTPQVTQQRPSTPAQPRSSSPIFDPLAETHNHTNMVIPEAEFSAEGAQPGYYVLNNNVYKGYLLPVGEINGVEVYVTKVPNITKGFGKQEAHVASTNYIAVFPNGASVTVMPNVVVETEQQAIDKIRTALNGNPQRITEEAAKETVLSKMEPPKVSGAAATVQVEQALKGESRRRPLKLREAKGTTVEKWDRKKEVEEIKKMLPQLSAEDRIRFVSGLIRVADRGALAWGQMQDGIITLSDVFAPGTAYHEAFHVVFNHLLDDSERAALLQEARGRFGKGLSEEALEEELAEEFRSFQMGEIVDTRSLGKKILDFFKNLLSKVKYWNNFRPSSMYYYQAIRKGNYANKTLKDVSVSRLNREEYTDEMKSILANAPRDSQGRLLAPNGKPSKLTERQYVHVRTKAFKEWFGDWINDPENASKVIDENGENATFEPLVVYHGSENEFNTFNPNYKKRASLSSVLKDKIYFTSSKYAASRYSSSKQMKDLLKYIELEEGGFSFMEMAEAFGFNPYNEDSLDEAAKYMDNLENRNIKTNLYEVFLNIREPINLDLKGKLISSLTEEQRDNINNSNGAIIKNVDETVARYRGEIVSIRTIVDDYIVSNPNQIKSATDNIGTYSKDNDDIRYRRTEETRVMAFNEVPQEERQILTKKGWTAEHFNRISQEERDKALSCLSL